MFRFLFKGPRTVRVPIERSNVEVQQVKVTKQSRPIVGRFILTFAITTVLIQGIKRWDPLGTYAQRDVLQEELERVKKEAQRGSEHGDKYGKHWDRQHSQMRNAQPASAQYDAAKPDTIRITVPIWLRQGYQRTFMPTDAEWKEFAKLQNDPKRINQIKRQIGESVMHQVKEFDRNQFELAVIKFNGRVGVALEIVPQVFTPPIYEVPCLWISTKSITAGWRPLPPQTGARMERVFRPVVLLEASTAAVRTFFNMTYVLTKARIMETLRRERSIGHKPIIVVPKLPPVFRDGANSADAPTDDSRSGKPFFPFFPALSNTDGVKKLHADVVSSMPYSDAIQHAIMVFSYVRNARQRLAVSTNVRGICQVRGFITFFGERGRFRLEVIAYYLPADNVFVGAVNVKSGYVVQDYRAWEKTIEKEKKQKEKKALDNKEANDPESPKTAEPPSTSTPGEDKEKNK